MRKQPKHAFFVDHPLGYITALRMMRDTDMREEGLATRFRRCVAYVLQHEAFLKEYDHWCDTEFSVQRPSADQLIEVAADKADEDARSLLRFILFYLWLPLVRP